MEKAPRSSCLLFEGLPEFSLLQLAQARTNIRLYMLLLVPGTVGTVGTLCVQVQKGAKRCANELKQCLLLDF